MFDLVKFNQEYQLLFTEWDKASEKMLELNSYNNRRTMDNVHHAEELTSADSLWGGNQRIEVPSEVITTAIEKYRADLNEAMDGYETDIKRLIEKAFDTPEEVDE